jgi:hypothetical protein
MASLTVAFSFRGRPASIAVTVVANDDPVGVGCDLLDSVLPPDAATGYPVCRAIVESDWDGYAAACGWIQVVRATDGDEGPQQFGIDPLTLFCDVNTPYAFFGVKPLLFDAPFRASRADLDWEARSFLCATPDGVMSRQVAPVAAFTWGFRVVDAQITISDPEVLPLAAWDSHAPMLAKRYPGWTFASAS